jgi:hypothetical protein
MHSMCDFQHEYFTHHDTNELSHWTLITPAKDKLSIKHVLQRVNPFKTVTLKRTRRKNTVEIISPKNICTYMHVNSETKIQKYVNSLEKEKMFKYFFI